MGRDLRVVYSNGNSYDFDGTRLSIIEEFFEKSWPKWYEKQYKKNPDFIFYYDLKINRKTLVKLYKYIEEDASNIKLLDWEKEHLLYTLGYILYNTGKKNKVKFEFW